MVTFDTLLLTRFQNIQKSISNTKETNLNITPIKCVCCGGQIDIQTGVCPFCDVQYIVEESNKNKKVELCNNYGNVSNLYLSGILTPSEARNIIGMAEQKLTDESVSPQIITHFLKLGTK